MTERPSSRDGIEHNGIDTTIRGLLDLVQKEEEPVPRWRLEDKYKGLLYLIGLTNTDSLPASHTVPERGRGPMDMALFLLEESGFLSRSLDGYITHEGPEKLIPIPEVCAWHKAQKLDSELAERSQQA